MWYTCWETPGQSFLQGLQKIGKIQTMEKMSLKTFAGRWRRICNWAIFYPRTGYIGLVPDIWQYFNNQVPKNQIWGSCDGPCDKATNPLWFCWSQNDSEGLWILIWDNSWGKVGGLNYLWTGSNLVLVLAQCWDLWYETKISIRTTGS